MYKEYMYLVNEFEMDSHFKTVKNKSGTEVFMYNISIFIIVSFEQIKRVSFAHYYYYN